MTSGGSGGSIVAVVAVASSLDMHYKDDRENKMKKTKTQIARVFKRDLSF